MASADFVSSDFFHNYVGDQNSTYHLIAYGEEVLSHNWQWLFRDNVAGPIFPFVIRNIQPTILLEPDNPNRYEYDPFFRYHLVDAYRPEYPRVNVPYIDWLWEVLDTYYYRIVDNINGDNAADQARRDYVEALPGGMVSATLEVGPFQSKGNILTWYLYDVDNTIQRRAVEFIPGRAYNLDLTGICIFSAEVVGPDSGEVETALLSLHPQLLWKDRFIPTLFLKTIEDPDETEFESTFERTLVSCFYDYKLINVYAYTGGENIRRQQFLFPSVVEAENIPATFTIPTIPFDYINGIAVGPAPPLPDQFKLLPYDSKYEQDWLNWFGSFTSDSTQRGMNYFSSELPDPYVGLLLELPYFAVLRPNTPSPTSQQSTAYFTVQHRETLEYNLERTPFFLDAQFREQYGYFFTVGAENNPLEWNDPTPPHTSKGRKPQIYSLPGNVIPNFRFFGYNAGPVVSKNGLRAFTNRTLMNNTSVTDLPFTVIFSTGDEMTNRSVLPLDKIFGTVLASGNSIVMIGRQGSAGGPNVVIPNSIFIQGAGINDPKNDYLESQLEYFEDLFGGTVPKLGALTGRLDPPRFMNPNQWLVGPGGQVPVLDDVFQFDMGFLRFTAQGVSGTIESFFSRVLTTTPLDDEEDPYSFIDEGTAISIVNLFWLDTFSWLQELDYGWDMVSNVDIKEIRAIVNNLGKIMRYQGIPNDSDLLPVTIPPMRQVPGLTPEQVPDYSPDGTGELPTYTIYTPRQAPRRSAVTGPSLSEADQFPVYWGSEGIYYFPTRRSTINDAEFGGSGAIVRDNALEVHSLPQLILAQMMDLTIGLSLPEFSANFLPSADLSGRFCEVDGLYSLVSEIAYVASSISSQTGQTLVSSMVTQAMTIDVLTAFGQPLTYKSIPFTVQEVVRPIPYVGLAPDAPSAMDQTSWILQNLAPIRASVTKPSDLSNLGS